QCGPREHRREKALDRTITAAFARPTGHTKHRNPACHRYHSPCNPTELSPGSRRHMRLQAVEKCYNGHHGLLRRLRVEVVVDYNSTTTLRQKPCYVRAFWRRYCTQEQTYPSKSHRLRQFRISCQRLTMNLCNRPVSKIGMEKRYMREISCIGLMISGIMAYCLSFNMIKPNLF